MKMASEEQETDYGLSSEAESPFDTFADTKRASNTENTQTSISFISQHEESGKQENKQYSSNINTEVAAEKLVAWAARLELESMTLKDSFTEQIDKISLSNNEQIQRLNDATLLQLTSIDNKLSKCSGATPDKNLAGEYDEQSYGKKLSKLETDFKTVKDKVNKLHANMIDRKYLMTCLSTNESKSIEALHNVLEQSVAASQAQLPEPVKRELNLFSTKALECLVTTNTKLQELQSQVEKQSKHLKELQESVKKKSITSNSSHIDYPASDIDAIKNFLRLLLPRIIGLEKKFDSISLSMNNSKKQDMAKQPLEENTVLAIRKNADKAHPREFRGEKSKNRNASSPDNTISNLIETETQSEVRPAAKRLKRN
ncbi:Piso0_000955 [Millerozyma farinosa CBS 7064]|uniref:Piso0_000955 protein n=1 Tax=Pichia sorbitophila (strain ATCC MYA-4447 / BCRC 22081 / CBS 7064 / NBRC 10061 / NRRL Y-12695) TaxID=559304 RepID=G8YQI5_PICSO|nr:Piso0_000955 [Millerozyma farinosa CBS 7064]